MYLLFHSPPTSRKYLKEIYRKDNRPKTWKLKDTHLWLTKWFKSTNSLSSSQKPCEEFLWCGDYHPQLGEETKAQRSEWTWPKPRSGLSQARKSRWLLLSTACWYKEKRTGLTSTLQRKPALLSCSGPGHQATRTVSPPRPLALQHPPTRPLARPDSEDAKWLQFADQ